MPRLWQVACHCATAAPVPATGAAPRQRRVWLSWRLTWHCWRAAATVMLPSPTAADGGEAGAACRARGAHREGDPLPCPPRRRGDAEDARRRCGIEPAVGVGAGGAPEVDVAVGGAAVADREGRGVGPRGLHRKPVRRDEGVRGGGEQHREREEGAARERGRGMGQIRKEVGECRTAARPAQFISA